MPPTSRSILRGALLAMAILVLAAGVRADAPRPTPPAFDLLAAIAAAQAGDTIRVPAGHYAGPVQIYKPLKLIADGRVVIEGSGEGNVITVSASDVAISGFIIRRTGTNIDHPNAGIFASAPRASIQNNLVQDTLFGIHLNNSTGSYVGNNIIEGKTDLPLPRRGDGIKLWSSHRSTVENNTLINCRDLVLWYSQSLTVRGNKVSHGRYGLHCMFASDAVMENNDVRDNSVGIFIMYSQNLELDRNIIAHNRGPSGFGLGIKDVDGVDCHDNVFVDNRVGIHIDNSPSRVDLTHHFYNNVIAFNDIGLGLMPSVHSNVFIGNSLLDNIQQIGVFGGGELAGNSYTQYDRGNYWSDYRGYDANGDGIGDVPHRSQSLFQNLMDREPKLRLFQFSLAQQAIELASRAFPIVKPQVRATDTAPLMHPVKPDLPALAAGRAWSPLAIVASIAMLAAGLGIVASARKEFS